MSFFKTSNPPSPNSQNTLENYWTQHPQLKEIELATFDIKTGKFTLPTPNNTNTSRIQTTVALIFQNNRPTENTSPKKITLTSPVPPKNHLPQTINSQTAMPLVFEQIKNFVASLSNDINGDNVEVETPEGKYVGPIREGKSYGVGKITVPMGTYEGETENGLPSGTGILTTFHCIIAGKFLNGCHHGECKIIIFNNEIMQKIFTSVKNGNPLTHAHKNYEHEMEISGNFQKGFIQGKGTGKKFFIDNNALIFKKYHEIYEGNFENGYISGYGVYTYRHDYKYYGNWVKDKREGFGQYNGPGWMYYGNWKDDKFHGDGTIKYSDGSYEKCQWENGIKTKVIETYEVETYSSN